MRGKNASGVSSFDLSVLIFAILFVACLVQWRLPLPVPGMPRILPLSTFVLAIVVTIVLIQERRRLVFFRPGWWPGAMIAALALGFLGSTWVGVGDGLKELVQYVEIYAVSACMFAALLCLGWGKSVSRGLAIMHGAALLLFFTGPGVVGLSQVKHAAFLVISLPFWLHWLKSTGDRLWQYSFLLVEAVVFGISVNHAGFVLLWMLVLCLDTVLSRKVGRTASAGNLPVPAIGLAVVLVLVSTLSIRPSRPSPWAPLSYRYDDSHVRRFYVEAETARNAPLRVPFGGGPGHYRGTINDLRLYRGDRIHPADMRVLEDGNSQYAVILVENGLPALLVLLAGFVIAALRLLRTKHADAEDANIDHLPLFCSLTGLAGCGLFGLSFSQGIGIISGAILGMSMMPIGTAKVAQVSDDRTRSFAGWRPAILAGAISAALIIGGVLLASSDRTAEKSPANRILAGFLTHGNQRGGSPLTVVSAKDTFSGQTEFGTIHVQAEACSRIDSPFRRITEPDAEGGACLEIADLTGKGTGSVSYTIDVAAAGRYRFSARVYWQDGCGNSVAFANGTSQILVASDVYGRWHLLESPKTIEFEAGPQTVSLINIEDGVRIDSWTLHYCLD